MAGNRRSTREFLLSRVAPGGSREPAAQKSSVGLVAFYREFPQVLIGDAFIDRVRTQMRKADRFGLLAIRIDRLTPRKDVPSERYAVQLLLDVGWAIDACCHGAKGLWGLMDRRSFGCFLPAGDSEASRHLAADIQGRLSDLRKETVSIGIALYPLARFRREESFANARKALRHALMCGPGSVTVFDAVSLNISGDRLYDKGDVEGAVGEFLTALALDPENVNVRNSLGVCYGRLNRFDQALAMFQEALALDPLEPMTFYNAGLVSLMRKDRQEALRYFHQAREVRDDFFEATLQIGRLHLEAGETEAGRTYLEQAAAIRPEPGPVHRHLGDCYTQLEWFREALRAYKKALRHNPSDAVALSAVGHLFDLLGESLEIAVLICRNSVEIAPDNGLCRYRLGELYFKQDRLDEALHEFLRASELGYGADHYIEQIHQCRTARAC